MTSRVPWSSRPLTTRTRYREDHFLLSTTNTRPVRDHEQVVDVGVAGGQPRSWRTVQPGIRQRVQQAGGGPLPRRADVERWARRPAAVLDAGQCGEPYEGRAELAGAAGGGAPARPAAVPGGTRRPRRPRPGRARGS